MNISKLLAAAVIGGTLCGVAMADESLVGFYLGAGLGNANVRVDDRPGDIALGLKEHHDAWKVTAGIRPISLIGVEVSYVDFGRVTATTGAPTATTTAYATARQTAGSVYGVGYLPLPLPLVDVFGKVGTTRVQTKLDGFLPNVQCVASGCNEFHGSSGDTNFTWGAGAQVNLPLTGLTVRAEYERYNVSNGSPDLASVSLMWRL
jgi:opacity protein-like surface antigen